MGAAQGPATTPEKYFVCSHLFRVLTWEVMITVPVLPHSQGPWGVTMTITTMKTKFKAIKHHQANKFSAMHLVSTIAINHHSVDWCPPYTGGVGELELPGWAPSGYESPPVDRENLPRREPLLIWNFHPLFSSLSQDDFQQLPASPETFLNVSALVPQSLQSY